MDLQSAGIKQQIQLAELDEWREKAYHSSKLYKERMKDGTISKFRSSISKRETRYYSLTPAFVCLVMVSIEASGKAHS